MQRCFCYFLQCLHTAKTFSAFCAATLVRKLEVCGRWVADTARAGDQRYILYHMTCSAYKNGKRKKELECWHLSPQAGITHDRALPSHGIFSQQPALEMAEHRLSAGYSELFLVSPCLSVWLLLSRLNCPYLNPRVFQLLPFQFSSQSCWWVSQQVTAWG